MSKRQRGCSGMALIYKIVTDEIWRKAEADGVLEGMPVDLADGFIHFSAGDQLRATAEKHFSGRAGLVLLTVETESLGAALKWEVSRGGALFPHLYAPLSLRSIVSAQPLASDDRGTPRIPEEIA